MVITKAIYEFQMNSQHFNNTRSFALAHIGVCARIVRPSLFYLFIYLINFYVGWYGNHWYGLHWMFHWHLNVSTEKYTEKKWQQQKNETRVTKIIDKKNLQTVMVLWWLYMLKKNKIRCDEIRKNGNGPFSYSKQCIKRMKRSKKKTFSHLNMSISFFPLNSTNQTERNATQWQRH